MNKKRDDKRLFRSERECVCCGATSRPRDNSAKRTVILAVCPYIVFRGSGKTKTANAGNVNVCADCFARVLAGRGAFQGVQAGKFLAALRERLSVRFGALLEADALEQVQRPGFDDDGNLVGGLF